MAKGLRIMKDTATPVTSIFSTNTDSNARFSFKIIKTEDNMLEIYAFAGEGRSNGGLNVTYVDPLQRIYYFTNAEIDFRAQGDIEYSTSAKLMIKFI